MAKSRKPPKTSSASETRKKPVPPDRDDDYADGGGRDRVARRAYELYLARGGGHGQDFDDWLAAERELRRRNRSDPGQGE
jgi:hypothetical protein